MHLDKVFIKHPNICLVLKKELVCVFSAKSNQKLKSDCKMLLEEFYHIADQRSFSNHHVKLSTIFILKMCFLKNSALASFVVLSVMAATLFITALKKTPFLRQSTWTMGISHLTNVLKMLRNRLFQILCWLVTAT